MRLFESRRLPMLALAVGGAAMAVDISESRNGPAIVAMLAFTTIVALVFVMLSVLMCCGGRRPKVDDSEEAGVAGMKARLQLALTSSSTTKIGRDATYDTYKAIFEGDNWVAIKIVNNESDAAEERFGREVAVFRRLGKARNDHVVQIKRVLESADVNCIVTELADGHNANMAASQSPELRKTLLLHVIKALVFLHSNDIAYLNLRPENVRCCDGVWKIVDFRRSRICEPPETEKEANMMDEYEQRITFCAPELLRDGYGVDLKKADSYSFGVLAWSVWSGQAPFDGLSERQALSYLLSANSLTDALPMPEDAPNTVARLVVRCLDRDPVSRPSFVNLQRILTNTQHVTTAPVDDDLAHPHSPPATEAPQSPEAFGAMRPRGNKKELFSFAATDGVALDPEPTLVPLDHPTVQTLQISVLPVPSTATFASPRAHNTHTTTNMNTTTSGLTSTLHGSSMQGSSTVDHSARDRTQSTTGLSSLSMTSGTEWRQLSLQSSILSTTKIGPPPPLPEFCDSKEEVKPLPLGSLAFPPLSYPTTFRAEPAPAAAPVKAESGFIRGPQVLPSMSLASQASQASTVHGSRVMSITSPMSREMTLATIRNKRNTIIHLPPENAPPPLMPCPTGVPPLPPAPAAIDAASPESSSSSYLSSDD